MGNRLHRARLGLLLLLLLLVPACSRQTPRPAAVSSASAVPVQPSSASSPGDPVLSEIRAQAIDPFFAAIRTGDLEALKKLVHPKGAQGLDTSVGKLVSGYQAMKVKDLEVTTGNSAAKFAKGRTVKVRGSYAIPDMNGKFEFGGSFEFKQSSSLWKLAGISWSGTPLWRVPGPLTRTDSEGAVVFHPPDFPGSEVAGFAAASLDRLGELGMAQGAPYLMVVAAEDYRSVAGARSVAAAMNRLEWTGERFEYGTPYVAIRSSSYLKADPERRKAVIVHELTHAALSRDVSPFTPDWLSEGLAVYYSGDLDLDALKLGGKTSVLEQKKLYDLDGQFGNGFDPDVRDTYSYAGAVVGMLSERVGEKAMLDMHNYFKTALSAEEINKLYDVPFLLDTVRQLIESEESRDLSEKFLAERFQMSGEDVDTATKEWVRKRW